MWCVVSAEWHCPVLCPQWQTAARHKHNSVVFILQIYRAKASEIHRPVQFKYNHMFLRYRGPLPDNSASLRWNSNLHVFFITVMRMDDYFYTLEMTLVLFQAGIVTYLQTSLCYVMIQKDSNEHREAGWLSESFHFAFSEWLLLCPAG